MSESHLFDYYAETIGEALCELGLWDLTTEAQRNGLTRAVLTSRDNESLAFYVPVDTRPSKDELTSEIGRLKSETAELERSKDAYRKRLANDHGIEARKLGVDRDGDILVFDGRTERL